MNSQKGSPIYLPEVNTQYAFMNVHGQTHTSRHFVLEPQSKYNRLGDLNKRDELCLQRLELGDQDVMWFHCIAESYIIPGLSKTIFSSLCFPERQGKGG